MQVWAAMLIMAMSSLPPIASVSLKTLSVDPSIFAAVKAMTAEVSKAEEIVKYISNAGVAEACASVLAEAKAFLQHKRQSCEAASTGA